MKYFSDETKLKMSEAAKKRCSSPEWLEMQHARGTNLDYETVKSLYECGHTQREIGEILGVSQKVVCKYMKRNGIKARIAAKRDQFGTEVL